jgi:hypothetical protein
MLGLRHYQLWAEWPKRIDFNSKDIVRRAAILYTLLRLLPAPLQRMSGLWYVCKLGDNRGNDPRFMWYEKSCADEHLLKLKDGTCQCRSHNLLAIKQVTSQAKFRRHHVYVAATDW